ncbi:MAG: hypothetical protein M1343_06940 [Chloroflexi bacterium]|nr:hypothetical protein [Chloroflexota bacterium]MDA8189763.1 hypothetical protein [Dehalococcoidales bacterium]
MERDVERNPFGIRVADIVLFAGLVIVAMAASKRLLNGSNDAPVPQGDVPKQTTMQIVNTDWRLPNLRDSTIHIEWIVNHLGPAGDYIAGIQIALSRGLFADLYPGHGDTLQSIEQPFSVTDDENYSKYTVATDAQLAVPGFSLYDVRQYVRTSNGRILTERWSNNQLIVI